MKCLIHRECSKMAEFAIIFYISIIICIITMIHIFIINPVS